jgi:hypothetical protein
MKKFLLLAAALAAVALTGTARAYSPADAPKPRVIPASVVNPSGLPRDFQGAIIRVEFTLDAAGQPHDIKVLATENAVVQRQLVEAFRQWRFDLGANRSAATGRRYILPLQLTPEA